MHTITRSRLVAAAAAIAVLGGACQAAPGDREASGVLRHAERPEVVVPDETIAPGDPVVSLEAWADFEAPLSLRAIADAWYVVERAGRVWRYDGEDRSLVLDISDDVSVDFERGLFDLVVSPDEAHAYIHFTGTEEPHGNSHIHEYRWTGSGVEGEPREVLVVEQPYPHHNGGQLQFGPDGYLYIGLGDGGTATLTQEPDNGDPHDHGQRLDVLLGKLLRIDPREGPDGPYSIPGDNPFVGTDGRDEIWAYGLRNPWRFSFDRRTGDLWLPDVGHRFQEEINLQPAEAPGGQNYGWNRMEGPLSYQGEEPDDHVLPVYAYPHHGGPCAIIGGYVYRGARIPDLVGWYLFGDFCTGELQAIRMAEGEVVAHRWLGTQVPMLVSLAEDGDGEIFALSHSEGIFRIGPLP